MFSNAKVIEAKPTAKKKAEKREVVIDGMEQLASLDALIKTLQGMKAIAEEDVKSQMSDEFRRLGAATKTRPDSFRGIEGDASASCELRIRSSASKLSDEEIELLSTHNIPVEEVVDTIETYVINPEYLADAALMGKVEVALKKVKDIPEDFIMLQKGKKKTVVASTALDVLFSTKKGDDLAALMPMLSVLAVKPTLKNDDIKTVLAVVQKMLVPTEETEEAA